MKFLLTVWLFVIPLLHTAPLGVINAASSGEAPLSVCQLAENPDKYSHQMVTVRAWIGGRKDISLLDENPGKNCPPEVLVLVLPNAVTPRPEFSLSDDASYRIFRDALSSRTHIVGTFQGRFDPAVTIRNGRRAKLGKGFGYRHRATMRLVLHRVSDLDIRTTRSVDR